MVKKNAKKLSQEHLEPVQGSFADMFTKYIQVFEKYVISTPSKENLSKFDLKEIATWKKTLADTERWRNAAKEVASEILAQGSYKHLQLRAEYIAFWLQYWIHLHPLDTPSPTASPGNAATLDKNSPALPELELTECDELYDSSTGEITALQAIQLLQGISKDRM